VEKTIAVAQSCRVGRKGGRNGRCARELVAYKYEGFWRAMDTLRDRQALAEMVEGGDAVASLQQNVAIKVAS
jgi:NDP-sugar pyrophosphorylase family protein